MFVKNGGLSTCQALSENPCVPLFVNDLETISPELGALVASKKTLVESIAKERKVLFTHCCHNRVVYNKINKNEQFDNKTKLSQLLVSSTIIVLSKMEFDSSTIIQVRQSQQSLVQTMAVASKPLMWRLKPTTVCCGLVVG
jgi:hypothetical protein